MVKSMLFEQATLQLVVPSTSCRARINRGKEIICGRIDGGWIAIGGPTNPFPFLSSFGPPRLVRSMSLWPGPSLTSQDMRLSQAQLLPRSPLPTSPAPQPHPWLPRARRHRDAGPGRRTRCGAARRRVPTGAGVPRLLEGACRSANMGNGLPSSICYSFPSVSEFSSQFICNKTT
ncbi:hypothetical protein SEVIR_1G382600v4 [Setaria viridis]|uniref:Uncharacterized protein n=1 Tax=Setaria viridis TaxID=4556 RepID=A0A4U6WHP8_SETVI|nr:hypothetical protein SEVIR_1G382600v2 [Setaria viridis]